MVCGNVGWVNPASASAFWTGLASNSKTEFAFSFCIGSFKELSRKACFILYYIWLCCDFSSIPPYLSVDQKDLNCELRVPNPSVRDMLKWKGLYALLLLLNPKMTKMTPNAHPNHLLTKTPKPHPAYPNNHPTNQTLLKKNRAKPPQQPQNKQQHPTPQNI